MWADKIFAELMRAVPNPKKWAAHHNAWISEATWILLDERVSARQETGRDQARNRKLGWEIQAELKEDRQRRDEMVGEEVEQLLTGDPPFPR